MLVFSTTQQVLVSYKPATASYAVVIFDCRTDDSRIGPGTGPWQTLRILGGTPDGSVVSNCILGENESESSSNKPLKRKRNMQGNGRTCASWAKKRPRRKTKKMQDKVCDQHIVSRIIKTKSRDTIRHNQTASSPLLDMTSIHT